MVAELELVLDRAVDPRADALDDRAAGRRVGPRDVVEAVVADAALGEAPAQVGLVVAQHVDAELPAGAIASHVSLLTIGRNPTSGGSSETDVNEPIVNPAGTSPAQPVTIVTPVGKCPSTLRNWAESNGERTSSVRGGTLIGVDGRHACDTSHAVQEPSGRCGPRCARCAGPSPPIPPIASPAPTGSGRGSSRGRRTLRTAGATVMLFESLPTEPETAGWFAWCRDHDVAAYAPPSTGPSCASQPGDVDPAALDVVVVPGPGVHRRRPPARPGRRPLRPLPAPVARRLPHVGAAFAEQLVDDLPTEPHDVRLTHVATDG